MIDSYAIQLLRRAVQCCAAAAVAAVLLAGAGCVAVAVVTDPEPVDTSASPVPAQAEVAVWHETLDAGFKDAQRRQRPMLVVYKAHGSQPCEALQKELELPGVRDKLAHWALVQLDVDHPEPGQGAYVGKLPGLRIAASTGKTVVSREGFISGKDLIRWLDDNAPRDGEVNADLAAADMPDAAATTRLLAMLGGTDADAREAAIRRLAPWPVLVATPAVAAFAKGNLRTRLAVLDLLQEWKAPVQGIDPWEPETIDADRLAALVKWSAAARAPLAGPVLPDADRIAAAQVDLSALLQANDPANAAVISSRLTRLGPALLPEVLRRLKENISDRDRARLTALRYRLAATEALSLGWPGGIDRLASSDPVTRRAAAEELSKRTTPADAPLLMELFGDPDPLVREVSLRGLLQIGGNEGAAMLVKLLHDPALNVRAAVLKQLAEQPDPDMTPAIVEYVGQEKDADLVVHAVGVLRAIGGSKEVVTCLIGLLNHPSWRVRAEAADALGEIEDNSTTGPREDVAVALARHIDDPDSFVAGRAIAALRPRLDSVSIDALMSAVNRRSDLALEVVKLLANVRSDNASALPAIRAFCSNSNPAVRAAAVAALAELVPENCSDEIRAALADKADDVRAAGAAALFTVLGKDLQEQWRGQGVSPAQWVEDFRSGKRRPAWYGACLGDLQAMLKSGQEPVRRAAAYPLVALGHDDQALPIIKAAAKVDSSSRRLACRILPWLGWNKRMAWTRAMLAVELTDAMTTDLAAQMRLVPDRRAEDAAWFLLDGNNGGGALEEVCGALSATYHVGFEPGRFGPAAPGDLDALKAAARKYVQHGSGHQRLVALGLLYVASATEAAEQAKKVCEDPGADSDLRVDALEIMLWSQSAADAQRSASAVLSAGGAGAATPVQHLALRFLALGGGSLPEVRELHLVITDGANPPDGGSDKPIDLKAPAGLSADVLLQYVKSGDREQAGYAGYLLCLMGRNEGLPAVLNAWKEEPDAVSATSWLAYRAIAALDDDSQTPVLEKIYGAYKKTNDVRDLYQTLRTMHGPGALKLQKQIRDEAGAQRLE